jgi:hypothetical protein
MTNAGSPFGMNNRAQWRPSIVMAKRTNYSPLNNAHERRRSPCSAIRPVHQTPTRVLIGGKAAKQSSQPPGLTDLRRLRLRSGHDHRPSICRILQRKAKAPSRWTSLLGGQQQAIQFCLLKITSPVVSIDQPNLPLALNAQTLSCNCHRQ